MVVRGPACVPGAVDVKDAELAPDEEVGLDGVAMVGGDADSEAGVRANMTFAASSAIERAPGPLTAAS
jgi:hypothetical protein